MLCGLQFKLLNDVDTPNKYELPSDLEIDKLERSLAFCMPNAVLIGLGFQNDGISAAEKLQVVEDVDILCRIEEEIVSLRRGILKRQQNYNELLELFRTSVSDEHKLREWADLCDAPTLPSAVGGGADAFRQIALSAIAVRMRARIAKLEAELADVNCALAKLHGGTVVLAAPAEAAASGVLDGAAAAAEVVVPIDDAGAAAATAPTAEEEDAEMRSAHSGGGDASDSGSGSGSGSDAGSDSDSGSRSHSGSDNGDESDR